MYHFKSGHFKHYCIFTFRMVFSYVLFFNYKHFVVLTVRVTVNFYQNSVKISDLLIIHNCSRE